MSEQKLTGMCCGHQVRSKQNITYTFNKSFSSSSLSQAIYYCLIFESPLKLPLEAKILTNPLSIYPYFRGQLRSIFSSVFLPQPFWLILNCPFVINFGIEKIILSMEYSAQHITGLVISYLSTIQTGLCTNVSWYGPRHFSTLIF